MEKVIFFFCVLSSGASVRGSSDLLRVQMGEDITLNCSMRNRYKVSWYHLRSEQLNLLISAEKDKTGRKHLITYNPNGLIMTADSWVTRVSLTISGITASDSGLYFCGAKSETPEMHFDNSIRLEIDGHSEEKTKAEDEITEEVTVTERVLMFGGVGLAAFVFLLPTVIAGGIIYHRGQQKGWKEAERAALMSHKSNK